MKNLRRIIFKHSHNFRDLGGYATSEDKVTKWHTLYRSDCLSNLTSEEWEKFKALNIKTIVDLRSMSEAKTDIMNVPEGIEYINFPVQKEEVSLDDENKKTKFALAASMEIAYAEMVDDNIDRFSEALSIITEKLENGALSYQCTAGKDRTGVTTAMILYICKVYNQDIIANYEITHTMNEEGINPWLRTLKQIANDESKLMSNASNMKAILNHFEKIDLPKKLNENGFTFEKQKRLQELMLEDLD